jgi:hypothetical protein
MLAASHGPEVRSSSPLLAGFEGSYEAGLAEGGELVVDGGEGA